jgi:DNA-binding NarL/FixJ family response regulator
MLGYLTSTLPDRRVPPRKQTEGTMKRITVLLADDHMIMREGLRKLLELDVDLEVIGEAEEGLQAVALAKELRPAVVLMDIDMPLLNGLEATRQVIKALPSTRVLILSAYSHEEYVRNAIQSGAMGFLLKQTSAHEVCRAVREVVEGKTFFSSLISSRVIRLNPQLPDRTGLLGKKIAQLTSRQVEVLQRIAEGKTNKDTALELGISHDTVGRHREHLIKKLDIHNTAGLTRYAIDTGIIESSVQQTAD